MFKAAKAIHTRHQKIQFVHDEKNRCESQPQKNPKHHLETLQRTFQKRKYHSNRKVPATTKKSEQKSQR